MEQLLSSIKDNYVTIIAVASFVIIVGLAIALRVGWRPTKRSRDEDHGDTPASSEAGHGEHHGSHGQKGNFWGNVTRVVGTLLVLSLAFNISLCGYRWYNDTSTPVVKNVPQYPYSGTGRGTKMNGVKAYLNPRKVYTRISKPAKFVFVANPSLYFEDKMPGVIDRTPLSQVWHDMPPGEYIVYPLEEEPLDFTWWHKE